MCYTCHMGLSDEIVISQLKCELDDPKFEDYNTTSLNHILLCIFGFNGEEAHNLANELAERFYEWFLGKTYGIWQYFYLYKPGSEVFPHSNQIRSDIIKANEFYDDNKNKTKEALITSYNTLGMHNVCEISG